MKQCGFHWNKAPITHFPRSLFGNLVADSDQLFLPVDIFPPQNLVLDVFSDQFTAAEASETRHSKKGISSGTSSGIELSRATLDGWGGELLRPISAAMGQELLSGSYIQADETTVGVQMHDGE